MESVIDWQGPHNANGRKVLAETDPPNGTDAVQFPILPSFVQNPRLRAPTSGLQTKSDGTKVDLPATAGTGAT